MEVAIVLILIAAVVAVIVLMVSMAITSSVRRKYLHKERIAALEKGMPLPDELLVDSAPAPRAPGNHGTAVAGIIWAGVGLGLLTSSSAALLEPSFGSEFKQLLAFLRVWAWPALFVGIGLLVYSWLIRDRGGRTS